MTVDAPLEFHALRVASVEPLTDDAVAVTFDVPEDLADTFTYLPGQHVTVRAIIDGDDVRRSYSICANANGGPLRVGIKRLPGGVFSTYATSRLAVGDELDVMPPIGDFTIETSADSTRRYAAIVAGSGITPVLSLVSTTLESEPGSQWTVVFGNRSAASVMFLEELEGLKDRYPDRLHLVHVLSREDTGLPLFNGRIDADKLDELIDRLIPVESVDDWYLCGPYQLVVAAHDVLAARGVPADRLHDELFFAGPPDVSKVAPPPDDEEGTVGLRFTLEGRASQVRMRPDTSILDAALAVRPELPYSCKGGMCASCKARVIQGEVTMDKNWALVEEDLVAGFVLTCQSHPTTEEVVVDFDQR